MPWESQSICMVAWAETPTWRSSQTIPYLHQGTGKSSRTSDPVRITRSTLAESRSWPIRTERSSLSASHRLFFSLHRGGKTFKYYFTRCATHLQSMFARHGIPEQLISDNGPQFSSTSFAKFAEDYGFTHILPSSRYPQANGEVERAVQTVKNLLKKTSDTYKALMAYRTTPLESGLSPAELLMGRKIRTRVPTSPSNLNPSWPYLEQFREKDAFLKGRQKPPRNNWGETDAIWIVSQKRLVQIPAQPLAHLLLMLRLLLALSQLPQLQLPRHLWPQGEPSEAVVK